MTSLGNEIMGPKFVKSGMYLCHYRRQLGLSMTSFLDCRHLPRKYLRLHPPIFMCDKRCESTCWRAGRSPTQRRHSFRSSHHRSFINYGMPYVIAFEQTTTTHLLPERTKGVRFFFALLCTSSNDRLFTQLPKQFSGILYLRTR